MQYLIKNLLDTPLEVAVDCLNVAFKDYFVKLPTDVPFWRKRFEAARVDYGLSYGAFHEGQLVGYLVHAVDTFNDELTAYNAGTGIIEAHRGKGLVQAMYDQAFKDFEHTDVSKCTLEVIVENAAAIKAYSRVGFQIARTLKSYRGDLNFAADADLSLTRSDLPEISGLDSFKAYSWDFSLSTMSRTDSQVFIVIDNNKQEPIGHFIIQLKSNTLAQVEAYENDYKPIFSAISQLTNSLRMVNIDEDRADLITFFEDMGFENMVDQYEMKLQL